MNRSLRILLALAWLALVPWCRALILCEQLTAERSEKEFGVRVRSTMLATNQTEARVEFSKTGPLAGFNQAQLEITREGRLVVSAVLEPWTDGKGISSIRFTTDPLLLEGCKLILMVRTHERTQVAYELKVKDCLTRNARL